MTPGEVAERLSALERRVEEALAGSGAPPETRDLLETSADAALAALAGVQRWKLRDALEVAASWTEVTRARMVLEDPVRQVTPLVGGLLRAAYHRWWRVEVDGLERVPRHGRVIVVANRSSALFPYEAFMLGLALADAGRADVRLLLDDPVVKLPVLGPALAANGVVYGTGGTLRRLLTQERAVVVLPEGQATVAKLYRGRYRLAPFGRATFARAAIQSGAPIVPVAVIGAEETHPVLARVDLPVRLLGLPALPLTPTFPWLGAAGLVPLPSKWTLLVGEPLEVGGRWPAEDASRPAAIRELRDQVRERLQALVLEALRRRRHLFRAS